MFNARFERGVFVLSCKSLWKNNVGTNEVVLYLKMRVKNRVRVPCYGEMNSLLCRNKFPVNRSRELASKRLSLRGYSTPKAEKPAKFDDNPCKFPIFREFRPKAGFAADWVAHHSVQQFLTTNQTGRQGPHVQAISRGCAISTISKRVRCQLFRRKSPKAVFDDHLKGPLKRC